MREAQLSWVVIEDICYEVIISILYFLYTDQCKVTLENVMSLFKAADIYGIRKLKSICEQTIISNISIQNAAMILMEADRHYADSLREVSLKFILKNFDPISKTEGFEKLIIDNGELAVEILRKRKIPCSNNEVYN